ncbi:hypothetical protein GC173_08250 [bacterium]|nr:hypothetical protein [bacterium]
MDLAPGDGTSVTRYRQEGGELTTTIFHAGPDGSLKEDSSSAPAVTASLLPYDPLKVLKSASWYLGELPRLQSTTVDASTIEVSTKHDTARIRLGPAPALLKNTGTRKDGQVTVVEPTYASEESMVPDSVTITVTGADGALLTKETITEIKIRPLTAEELRTEWDAPPRFN